MERRFNFIWHIWQSFNLARTSLQVNLLRSMLSLLGVTIGIFATIAVFSIVDSLEKNIKESLRFLGSSSISVAKWPYRFSNDYPWWKYQKRPQPVYEEYLFLSENVDFMQGITIISVKSNVLIKQKNNSSSGNTLAGIAHGHKDVYEMSIVQGRYFTAQESDNGNNVAIIGHNVRGELFPFENPVGQQIKIQGIVFKVIGILEKEGKGILGAQGKDEVVFIPYKSFIKKYLVGKRKGIGSSITVKGLESDPGLLNLEGELRGLMRKKRGLRPRQEDDFALNRPEAISYFIESIFNTLWWGGWIIGGFSILVGGFGIANIMFVSVKERTALIGIQKSLGAKNYFILSQFLIESIFLSLSGGSAGIILVYLLSFIELGALGIMLSFGNILLGLAISVIVGTLSGIAPAITAAKMDPVVAIRTQ